MGIFSGGNTIFTGKDKGYNRASNSPGMKKLTSNPNAAKYLETSAKREEFFRQYKLEASGTKSENEALRRTLAHFRSGQGKNITAKGAQGIAQSCFSSSSDRYSYASSTPAGSSGAGKAGSSQSGQSTSSGAQWLGKYGQANIKSNIILKGEANPNQGKALRRALSREEIEGMNGNNPEGGSFSRALRATTSKNKTN